VIFFKKNRGYG